MANVLPFPARGGDRVQLADALAGLARHLEQVRSSLGQSIALLDKASILPDIRAELAVTAGRANDLADWLAVVRRQLPGLPPDSLNPAVVPLIAELGSLDHQATAILRSLPGRIETLRLRR